MITHGKNTSREKRREKRTTGLANFPNNFLERFKDMAVGLFSSKLLYALPIFGSTWGFLDYREKASKKTTDKK